QFLAQLIARNPSGNFALSANYNAKHDGKYTQSPIQTPFQGNFEGLGNFITGLHIESTMPGQPIGLLQQIMPNAILDNLRMRSVVIDGDSFLGGLAADNQGTINNNSVDGIFNVQGDTGDGCTRAGELVGINEGTILSSHSSGSITATGGCFVVGGLAGVNGYSFPGYIGTSYSTSNVSGASDNNVDVGGLVGDTGFGLTDSLVITSYATGNVSFSSPSGAGNAEIGGLAAFIDQGLVSQSAATGPVSALSGSENQVGGLVGGARGSIDRSTATGAVSAGQNCYCGGFVGNGAPVTISNSNSYGSVTADPNSYIGGFVGYDHLPGDMVSDGWCTTSSGITDPSQGAGNVSNDPGITPFTC
ncbi:MAG TPA: GLUG motif-containing protein, partial [Rhizomicrobium sp.]|nr:GLUG motif-containing protein [Rhizomicrobium sp.]